MSLKGVAYPGGGSSLNTIFVDDRYGSALGTSVMDMAPLLAAWSRPLDYCRDFDDFNEYNATTSESYTISLNSGSAALVLSTNTTNGTAGGVVSVASSTTANAETSIQRTTCWNLHATKDIYHAIRFNKATSATIGGFVVGMTTVDATPAGGLTDGIYFIKADASAAVSAVTTGSSSSTTTASVATVVADTNLELGFIANSTSVKFFTNGVLVATHTTTIPATTIDLRVNIAPRANAAGTTASTLIVDYHDTLQARTV